MLAVDYQTLLIWGGGVEPKKGEFTFTKSRSKNHVPLSRIVTRGNGDSSRRGKDIYAQTLSTL